MRPTEINVTRGTNLTGASGSTLSFMCYGEVCFFCPSTGKSNNFNSGAIKLQTKLYAETGANWFDVQDADANEIVLDTLVDRKIVMFTSPTECRFTIKTTLGAEVIDSIIASGQVQLGSTWNW